MQVYHNNPINQPQTTTTMTPQPTTPITPKYKINQKLVHKNPKGNDIKDGTILIPKYVGTCEQGIYYFCETSNGDRRFMRNVYIQSKRLKHTESTKLIIQSNLQVQTKIVFSILWSLLSKNATSQKMKKYLNIA